MKVDELQKTQIDTIYTKLTSPIRTPDTDEKLINEAVERLRSYNINTKGLIIVHDASHTGYMNPHGRMYMSDYDGIKDDMRSWYSPFPKALVATHDEDLDAVGKIYAAGWFSIPEGHYEGVQMDGVVKTAAHIPNIESNKDVIDRITTGLYNTVSSGFNIRSAKCSICNIDWMDPQPEEECEHFPNKVYDGKMMYLKMRGFKYRHLALVNMPAHDYARPTSIVSIDNIKKAHDKLYTRDKLVYLQQMSVIDEDIADGIKVSEPQLFADAARLYEIDSHKSFGWKPKNNTNGGDHMKIDELVNDSAFQKAISDIVTKTIKEHIKVSDSNTGNSDVNTSSSTGFPADFIDQIKKAVVDRDKLQEVTDKSKELQDSVDTLNTTVGDLTNQTKELEESLKKATIDKLILVKKAKNQQLTTDYLSTLEGKSIVELNAAIDALLEGASVNDLCKPTTSEPTDQVTDDKGNQQPGTTTTDSDESDNKNNRISYSVGALENLAKKFEKK